MDGVICAIILMLFFGLLACAFYFLGRLWSSLSCGFILLVFTIYIDYYGTHNKKFYCNKIINKCSFMENTRINKDFKEINYFNISNIEDIKYEEVVRTRYRRKRGIKKYLDKNIVFIMKDKSNRFFPSEFISSDTQKNQEITENIISFLNGENIEFQIQTNKEDTISYLRWIFLFIVGCIIGLCLYERLLKE